MLSRRIYQRKWDAYNTQQRTAEQVLAKSPGMGPRGPQDRLSHWKHHLWGHHWSSSAHRPFAPAAPTTSASQYPRSWTPAVLMPLNPHISTILLVTTKQTTTARNNWKCSPCFHPPNPSHVPLKGETNFASRTVTCSSLQGTRNSRRWGERRPSSATASTTLIECLAYVWDFFFFFFVFLPFLGPILRHMEVPRLGVESEL